jgi:GT2 family glycosyltransferase
MSSKRARRAGTVAVFLNYRTPNETVRAVSSLQSSRTSVDGIVVVDNGSTDGSPQQLASALRGVHLITSDTNLGFSGGCNLGIREALRLGAERVLLLNSDVVVPPDLLGALDGALRADRTLGIVGPVLVSAAAPHRVESMGIRYSRLTGRMRHEGYGQDSATLRQAQTRMVSGVAGCAMMVSREVFAAIGLLREEYFFGFEDLDFCLRASAAGFRVACVGAAAVMHEGSTSIGRDSALRIYFATRNHLLVARRFAPSERFAAGWVQTASVLAFGLAHVLFTSEVPRRRGLKGFAAGVHDHFAGRYGAAAPAFEQPRQRPTRSSR